jgi:hypothetical protein
MLFDQATDAQMQAAQIATGVTMAGMIGANVFGRHAWRFRAAVAVVYIAGVLGFVAYVIL